MYNIKTLNNISSKGLERLSSNLFAVDEEGAQPDGILVRSAAMQDMALPESLLGIARAGAGVNNIPVDKCSEAGIVVFNTPGANANAVKELVLGGLVLVGIGAWFVLDWLRRLGPAGEAEGENRAATLWGCVSLAAALAVDLLGFRSRVLSALAGAVMAAGWAALANFLVTLAALPLGRALGDKLAGRLLGKYALPLSGALLVLLGIWEAVG